MIKYAFYFKDVHEAIKAKKTGSLPEFADRLGVCKTTVKNIISAMKIAFNAPIVFSYQHNSYIYEHHGLLVFDFYKLDLDELSESVKKSAESYFKELL